MRLVHLSLLLGLAWPVQAQPTLVDSFVEVQSNDEVWLFLRYLAPEIGGHHTGVDYEAVLPQMDEACLRDAISLLPDLQHDVENVMITLMSAPVRRGEVVPEVRVLNSSYRIHEGVCEWM